MVGIQLASHGFFAEYVISELAVIDDELVYAHLSASLLLAVAVKVVNDELDIEFFSWRAPVQLDVRCGERECVYMELVLEQLGQLYAGRSLVGIYEGVVLLVKYEYVGECDVVEVLYPEFLNTDRYLQLLPDIAGYQNGKPTLYGVKLRQLYRNVCQHYDYSNDG